MVCKSRRVEVKESTFHQDITKQQVAYNLMLHLDETNEETALTHSDVKRILLAERLQTDIQESVTHSYYCVGCVSTMLTANKLIHAIQFLPYTHPIIIIIRINTSHCFFLQWLIPTYNDESTMVCHPVLRQSD